MPSVFTVLANIPWGQVVEHAPKLAQGAARLWENMRRRQQQAPAEGAVADPSAAMDEPARLQARLQGLEVQVQQMQDELRASAEVVKELAEQNALLVERVEALHRRFRRVAWAGGVAIVALAVVVVRLLG